MRPAGLPRSLNIAGHKYSVGTRAKGRLLINELPHTKTSLGISDYAKGTIQVRDLSGESPSQLRDTLLHEVIHACIAEGGLRAHGGSMAKSSDGQEEQIARILATNLLDTLRRNPNLAKFLLEK